MARNSSAIETSGIAIIGMAGRFPGASSVTEFWGNLCAGVESIEFASDEELISAGISPELFKRPDYLRAGGIVKEADYFDASFFGMNAREAEILDPQQRVFLECCWDAFEDAGYDPMASSGEVGVFAGVGMNTYSLASLFNNPAILESAGPYQVMLGNDKDFLATRVAYKLNLRGPAIGVQTACSTSLVAVQMAFESLRRGECDAALAGGVSIAFPQSTGYQYVPGMILSPDGHCRAFDSRAAGTVPGRGSAVVLLKRLEDAISDRDHIYAVIRGAAINNDGSFKAGYSAPSIEGQSRVIRKSMEMAGFAPHTVRYVEAHGTGTEVGDPIEVAALSQAFGPAVDGHPRCTLGSVKTNIGHLDIAAGVTGLIKAALAVRNRLIPPTIHYEKPNPRIPFESTPFNISNAPVPYDAPEPFRAGVSSFGIGGTNAHVSIEETASVKNERDSRPQLIVLSGRTEEAVTARCNSLKDYLADSATSEFNEIAWTLQTGRHPFRYRRSFVASSAAQARETLSDPNSGRVRVGVAESREREFLFLFPGQGSQYLNMGRGLYDSAPVFREAMDSCSEFLKPLIGVDLREALYPGPGQESSLEAKLEETWLTQPALFAIEYAIAKLWMSCGITPAALLGHSVGEYVAACAAGIFSLEDSLRLIALRGRLIFSLPPGAMLAVSLSERQAGDLLQPGLAIAAINAPSQTVVSGPIEAIANFEKLLESRGVANKRLQTSHAFHSAMLDPIIEEFVKEVSSTPRSAPKIPVLSNLSGTWLTDDEAIDPGYWGRHLRKAVRFSDCAAVVAQNQKWIVIEAGPGETLLSFIRRRGDSSSQVRVNSMRQPTNQQDDYETWLAAVGRVWLAGRDVKWSGLHAPHAPFRVSLPGYPFERQRYWIEPASTGGMASITKTALVGRKPAMKDWFYVPSWRKSSPLGPERAPSTPNESVCLLLGDEKNQEVRSILESLKRSTSFILVNSSSAFHEHSDNHWSVSPQSREQWETLIRRLLDRGVWPDRIVYAWTLDSVSTAVPHPAENPDFFGLMALVQAIGSVSSSRNISIHVLTSQAFSVIGEPATDAIRASLNGMARTIAVECPNISCKIVDVGPMNDGVLTSLGKEIVSSFDSQVVALRNSTRWTQTFEPVRISGDLNTRVKLTPGGTYLITGGQGGLGTTFAERLARLTQGHFVMTSRQVFPAEEHWERLVDSPDTSGELRMRIEALQLIRAAGGSVHLMQADSADASRMREVVDWCREKLGGLHGIIHAAGVAPRGMILTKTREQAEQVLQPKILGSSWIEEVLRNSNLDFVLLCSSISAITPGPGDADYATGNAYLDALAIKWDNPRGTRVISAAWDRWRGVGISTDSPEEAFRSIEREDGGDAFELLLACPVPHIVVSTRDLNLLIVSIADQVRNAVANVETAPAAKSSLHPRPEISQPYAEPSDETERGVTEIWSELLGIEKVGKFDNFFELGGHSLLGTQMMIRIRQKFGLDLPLRTVFEAPTPAELANLLRAVPWASGYTNAPPMVESEREEIEF